MEKFAAWENLHRHSAELMDAKLVKGVSPACIADARQFSTQRILNETESDCCRGEAGRPVQLNTACSACIKLTRPVSSSGAPGAHTFTH